jgi:DNA-directed RNA polymerase I subunit RPA12
MDRKIFQPRKHLYPSGRLPCYIVFCSPNLISPLDRTNMPVQFCTDCGDLLPISYNDVVACEHCGVNNRNALLNSATVSSTSQFPSTLRDKRSAVKTSDAVKGANTWATIDEKCPKCSAETVRYTTVQLRSADEGTTVIYSCSNCSSRWNEDN